MLSFFAKKGPTHFGTTVLDYPLLILGKHKSVVFRIYRGRLTCGSRHVFESFVTAPLACNLFTHTQLHTLRTLPQLSTQTMNSMKLENVVPLPLEFNEYAEATLDTLGEEARMTPTKLWKYKTVVYTVLKALAVPLRSFRFSSYNFLLLAEFE